MGGDLTIRFSILSDLKALYKISYLMKNKNEFRYFEKCFNEQNKKNREIIIAEFSGDIIGYAQLIWSPVYTAFKRFNIPEIQDLNIIPEYRNRGIGSKLIDFCESRVIDFGAKEVGIGVGLNSSYGAAQRLYIKKGYIPDGLGVCYDDKTLSAGDLRAIDDLLTLKLTKKIR